MAGAGVAAGRSAFGWAATYSVRHLLDIKDAQAGNFGRAKGKHHQDRDPENLIGRWRRREGVSFGVHIVPENYALDSPGRKSVQLKSLETLIVIMNLKFRDVSDFEHDQRFRTYREISAWLRSLNPSPRRTDEAQSVSSTCRARAANPRGWVSSG